MGTSRLQSPIWSEYSLSTRITAVKLSQALACAAFANLCEGATHSKFSRAGTQCSPVLSVEALNAHAPSVWRLHCAAQTKRTGLQLVSLRHVKNQSLILGMRRSDLLQAGTKQAAAELQSACVVDFGNMPAILINQGASRKRGQLRQCIEIASSLN